MEVRGFGAHQVDCAFFGRRGSDDLYGGTLISKPDQGLREENPAALSHAEPIHVFREAYNRIWPSACFTG